MIACPGCGELGALRDHVIDGEGAVYPSFVCHECGFHANVNLEGWPP